MAKSIKGIGFMTRANLKIIAERDSNAADVEHCVNMKGERI